MATLTSTRQFWIQSRGLGVENFWVGATALQWARNLWLESRGYPLAPKPQTLNP